MEYTIQKLARLAGVTTRTLRYYDKIGLLKPARINSSGYRIYGQNEVNLLQQIMFYRELGLQLETIKEIIHDPSFNRKNALKEHLQQLIAKRKQIDLLIEIVKKTIKHEEGRIQMSDQEKFEGFKKRLVEENEKKYGDEVRERWGEEALEASNQKVLNMSQEDYEKVTKLAEDVNQTLAKAMETGDPASEIAQRAADLHKQWLTFYWKEYSKEAHAGLAQMYVDDERFKAYYDKVKPGAAEFLRDAILVYTGQKQ
ncbi:MerR family transcriptional regulator [Pallidibacillus thermolactis]|uniref:MerR family transcriptional regulator n=1 Tax=Pallidibacillus thermolactis TaxID=251051 RepID=UPI00156A7E77|nr:MerR family transcriptional regulator [Pallidibacillus thermolactis]MED1672361.1 MerR family transcriptional regulator [Pallidibacillus thermolactis subsp. kokeshiiformis]